MYQGEGRMFASQNEPQKNETCRRLIAAASEEFAQHGFASARIRAIADSAHVNLAAVNYYFGSKEGLYRATLRHLSGQPSAGPVANRRGRSPQARLHRRVYALLDQFVGSRGPSMLGRILAHEAIDPTSHIENVVAEAMRPELDRILAAVREIAGPAVPEAEVMQTSIGVLGQCLLYQFARPALQRLYPAFPEGAVPCRVLARHITDMTVAGIQNLSARHADNVQSIGLTRKNQKFT
jgi:TetR/AcrR family transcriptional regulator, regulator of cefoperazone and chloramphenicol sensitivity